MDKTKLITALVNNGGIEPKNALPLADDLVGLKAPFDGFLERWLEDPSDIADYELEGISISGLMGKAELTYPAALSTMNWILEEGSTALEYIKNSI